MGASSTAAVLAGPAIGNADNEVGGGLAGWVGWGDGSPRSSPARGPKISGKMVGEVGGDGEGEPPTSPLDAAVVPVTAADAGFGSTGLGNAGEDEGLIGTNATGRLCGLDGAAPCKDMYRNQYTEINMS